MNANQYTANIAISDDALLSEEVLGDYDIRGENSQRTGIALIKKMKI